MSESTEVSENHSTVGFSYKARLELNEKVPTTSGKSGNARQVHLMNVAGRVHPEPYNHDAAVILARRKLQPLVELGWNIDAFSVTAYGEDPL